MVKINKRCLCEHCFRELPWGSRTVHDCGGSDRDKYPNALPVGFILAGRYVVGRVLGQGGFGVTYLCYDSQEDRRVAVKEFFPSDMVYRKSDASVGITSEKQKDNFARFRKKFYEEARTVSQFNGNPNIVRVLLFFEENGTAYFSMEYLEGMDLKHYLLSLREAGVHATEGNALFLLRTVADTLRTVHDAKVLHRDIAPDNIFLCADGEVKLVDFGASKLVIGQATRTLTAILKPGFAPFEQYSKEGDQGPWTDIYALGATVYLMLTDELIPDAPSRVTADAPIPRRDISEGLYQVLMKMLAVLPENRLRSIEELQRELDALDITPEPIVLSPEEEEPELEYETPVRKYMVLGASILGAVIVMIVSAALIWYFANRSEGGGEAELFLPPAEAYINDYEAYVFCIDKEVQDYAKMRLGPDKTVYEPTGHTIPNYTSVTVLTDPVDGWCLCRDGEQEGWVRGDFLFRDMNDVIALLENGDAMPMGLYRVDINEPGAGELLNMRDAPRQEGALVAALPNGTEVAVEAGALIQSDRVYASGVEEYAGKSGYLLVQYLRFVNPLHYALPVEEDGALPAGEGDDTAGESDDTAGAAVVAVVSADTLSGTVLGSSNIASARRFDASMVIDGDGETCWCVNTDEAAGAGGSLRLNLSGRATVSGVRLVNGNMLQMEESLYLSNGQAREFRLTFSDGSFQTFRARKNDVGADYYQTFYLEQPVETDSVTLTVLSGYEGAKYPNNVCIGEINVF